MTSRVPLPTFPPPLIFRARFDSTRCGAREARRAALRQLSDWGVPDDGPVSFAAASVTAELCANAVAHGLAPGRRRFGLCMRLTSSLVRVEVSDARPDLLPPAPSPTPTPPPPDAQGGRGLIVVATLTQRWGYTVLDPYLKIVWAEVPSPGPLGTP